jgi:undecaprenyl pyrophosphate synthase
LNTIAERMNLKEQIKRDRLPRHVAMIMDGNGRWAQKKGGERLFGHRNAVESVRQVVEAAGELGVEYLTLYAFSTENWSRPKAEIDGLMALLTSTIAKETSKLNENNVRLLVIGNMADLPGSVQRHLMQAVNLTSGNTGLQLVLGLSYSGRWEITHAVRQMCRNRTWPLRSCPTRICSSAPAVNGGSVISCSGNLRIRSSILPRSCGPTTARSIFTKPLSIIRDGSDDSVR